MDEKREQKLRIGICKIMQTRLKCMCGNPNGRCGYIEDILELILELAN